MTVELWKTQHLPFTIGAMTTAENGPGLPGTLPFVLGFDDRLGLVRQVPDESVTRYLARAYAVGSLLGTAMDDTPLGRHYAEDFVAFLERNVAQGIAGRRVLEVGAGRGFLLQCLQAKGAECLGIEPGLANAPYWARYGVSVLADSFPSPRLSGNFDLVLAYAVLEHIAEPADFLTAVIDSLRPGGMVAFSVPDCTPFIAAGDPAMLLHEHYMYFTADSLTRLFAYHGLRALSVERAGYGGALYVIAVRDPNIVAEEIAGATEAETSTVMRYGGKCEALIERVSTLVSRYAKSGRSLGIYCPARGLSFLPPDAAYRFFDDDPELTGRYYPPFKVPVESRERLIGSPVDELWILSRTFGERLRGVLNAEPALFGCCIRVLDELVPEVE
ncbi:class I SAM-dependent methyltransferase [Ferrovibrio sp.]|uniref:class I SAM-dependent methyltransferase n=1 Tax=Ferrovibrio sp. TaxID=1917215 RepID=UPI003D1483B5